LRSGRCLVEDVKLTGGHLVEAEPASIDVDEVDHLVAVGSQRRQDVDVSVGDVEVLDIEVAVVVADRERGVVHRGPQAEAEVAGGTGAAERHPEAAGADAPTARRPAAIGCVEVDQRERLVTGLAGAGNRRQRAFVDVAAGDRREVRDVVPGKRVVGWA
jgi:hypothetical protein